jgi:hypothetical protein
MATIFNPQPVFQGTVINHESTDDLGPTLRRPLFAVGQLELLRGKPPEDQCIDG